MELLLGCGHSRTKRIHLPGNDQWQELVTLDNNPDCNPDYLWDLSKDAPLPFEDNTFDEIHAYEVLEHIAHQGDHLKFFKQFGDYWRILKPNGIFCATVPAWNSKWAFGDPSHTRVINDGTLAFLFQEEYTKQLGHTAMSDYRTLLGSTNFSIELSLYRDENFVFILKALK